MRLPAGRYRTPLSRASTARRKREPPRREVPEFKRRSRAERGARDPDFTRMENAARYLSSSVFLAEWSRLFSE